MERVKFIVLTPTQLLRMRIGTHVFMMSNMVEFLSAYQTENEEFHRLLGRLAEAVRHEYNYVNRVYGSSHSQQFRQADAVRSHLYQMFKKQVRGYARLRELPENEAAKPLAEFMESFSVDQRDKMRDRQNDMMSTLLKIEKDYRENIVALHLEHLFGQLMEYNQKAWDAYEARDYETVRQVPGASRAARVACNEACYELFDFVESMYKVNRDKELLSRIEACNTEIKRSLIESKGRKREKNEELQTANDVTKAANEAKEVANDDTKATKEAMKGG